MKLSPPTIPVAIAVHLSSHPLPPCIDQVPCLFWQGSYVLCFALAEAVATFNEFFQTLGEAGCWGPIDQIVIEAQCDTEVFPDSDVSVDDPWFLSDTTQGEIKGMVIDRDAPTGTLAKHTHCRDTRGSTVLLLHRGRPALHPPENRPEDSEDHQRQPAKILEALPGLLYCIHLGCPDLVMDLAKSLLIRGSDDVDNGLLLLCHLTLNHCSHVHIIKHEEVFAAFAVRLQGLVLIDRFCQTGDNESRERQGLPSGRFVFLQKLAGFGQIDVDQAMYHGLALG